MGNACKTPTSSVPQRTAPAHGAKSQIKLVSFSSTNPKTTETSKKNKSQGNSRRLRRYGKFPQVNLECYINRPKETTEVKGAIKQLLESKSRDTHLEIVGPETSGKTTILARLAQHFPSEDADSDFIWDNFPTVRAVIWVNIQSLYAKSSAPIYPEKDLRYLSSITSYVDNLLNRTKKKNTKPTTPASGLVIIDFGNLPKPANLGKLRHNRAFRYIAISRQETPVAEWPRVNIGGMVLNTIKNNEISAFNSECHGSMLCIRLGKSLSPDDMGTVFNEVKGLPLEQVIEQVVAHRLKANETLAQQAAAFLIYEPSVLVGSSDLSLLWQLGTIEEGIAILKNDFEPCGFVEAVLSLEQERNDKETGSHEPKKKKSKSTGEASPLNDPAFNVCIPALVYSAIEKFFGDKAERVICDIVKAAGRNHKSVKTAGGNVLHLAVDNVMGPLLKQLVKRLSEQDLISLCQEKNSEGQTPLDRLRQPKRLFTKENRMAFGSGGAGERHFLAAVSGLLDKIANHIELLEPVLSANDPLDVTKPAAMCGHGKLINVMLSREKQKEAEKNDSTDSPSIATKICHSALMKAAHYGHLELVKQLLANGADVNHRDEDDGATVLCSATAGGFLDVVTFLLENNADPAATVSSGYFYEEYGEDQSCLLQAVTNDSFECVKFLLQQPVVKDKKSQACVVVAASAAYGDIMDELLAAEFDVNSKTKKGTTALMEAARKGHSEIVKKLLGAGADPEIKNKDKRNALQLAILGGRATCVEALLGDQAPKKPESLSECRMIEAIKTGNMDAFEKLLAAGANANSFINNIASPLCLAVESGFQEMVEKLLGKGASPNTERHLEEGKKTTALVQAIEVDNLEVAKVLLQKGADVNQPSSEAGPPLISAVRNDNTEMVKLLLQSRASANVVDAREKDSALILAVRNGNKEIVELLVNYGANVRVTTQTGQTALTIAEKRGLPEIIEILFEAEERH